MSEIKSFIKIKINSEKSFGLTFSIIFLIFSIYFFFNESFLSYILFVFSLFFFLASFFFNKLLILPNKIWFKFGEYLGLIISPIIMGLIFFIIITPIGIVVQYFVKTTTYTKLDKSIKSYWIERKTSPKSMKEQF
tara:strand:- start:86 stop:490 length:405 start_codon:yes stop_codon:yes gene_type:complete